MKNQNPYAWNTVNPDLCYGRDDILSDFLNGLTGISSQSFALSGGGRMGKSTILRRTEDCLKSGVAQWRETGLFVIPIYVDGLALPRPLAPSDVWSYILKEAISQSPDESIQVPNMPDFSAFKDTIKSFFSSLIEEPRVIILFDDTEIILKWDWADGFLANWRALLSNTPKLSRHFTAVFAGAKEISALQKEITSPLANILEWRSLRVLDYEDACQLMQEPIEKTWPEGFLSRAYKETGGHPMLLQYVMQHVFSLSLSSSEKPEYLLDIVIAKFLRQQRRHFNNWWGKYCSLTAQEIYMRLPASGKLIPLRELTREFGVNAANDALEILQHVGLVTRNEDDLSFCYNGEMFRRWCRENGIFLDAQAKELEALIKKGEGEQLEFKETAFLKREWKKKDLSETDKVVKTIAAFLNSTGGDLLIGVDDSGKVVGIEEDIKIADPSKQDKDGYVLTLRNKLERELGGAVSFEITFSEIEGKIICRINVKPTDQPVYMGVDKHLFKRSGNKSIPLNPKDALDYIRQRFPNH